MSGALSSRPLVDADALRQARERAGLTQHGLARLVGVAGGERVSRWERGASDPRPETLQRIAKALQVEVQGLLTPSDGDADLRRLRVLAGLSARQVAERTHVSVPTYARWEAGQIERPLADATLEALGEALGVAVSEVTAALAAIRRGAG